MSYNSMIVLTLCASAHSHGIFWEPTSRAQLAQLSGWETDATSIISEPMPDVADDRPYPGGRPWAEPGKSISNVGPCGQKGYDQMTNWNMPFPDAEHGWGDVQATYSAGDVVDIEWCVSDLADHGGLYSYRMCTDDSIVAKFIDASYTPNNDDFTALESCFQAGILACDDVDGQECPIHPDCVGTGWGCENATAWFNCGPKDDGRCAVKGTGEKCATHGGTGSILRDQVKLPDHTSNHTLIGFRWDCQDTPQLWMHCADVALV